MKTKKVVKVVAPRPPHYVGDGFRVHNFIPSAPGMDMRRMDPFIMLDYGSKHYFPPSEKQRGVGVHPHRGFETVTIAYKGRVAHHDSSGGGGIIGEGDVQWMTAASGVLHKEYHEETFSREGGEFQMVQLWVNLPARYKMTAPKYQALAGDEMARVVLPDGEGTIEVIAGEYDGTKGSASTFSPVHLMNLKATAGANVPFSFPPHFNTALLVVEGAVEINGSDTVPTDHMALFDTQGDSFWVRASEDSVVLVLSGEPINEPIAAQGPFVMNTREELIQAVQDFYAGKFGELEE